MILYVCFDQNIKLADTQNRNTSSEWLVIRILNYNTPLVLVHIMINTIIKLFENKV